MRDYPLKLAIGQVIEFDIEGDSFHIVTAPSEVKVTLGTNETEITRYQGMGGQSPKPYTSVKIRSLVAQDIIISLGYGGVSDSRSNLTATISTSIAPANLNTPLALVTILPLTRALLATSKASRKELRIGVASTNTTHIHFGDVTVDATNGGIIEVGGIDYVSSEGAIYAYNPHAVDSVIVNLVSMERL